MKSAPKASATSAASIPAESIAIPQNEATPAITLESALEFIAAHFKLSSTKQASLALSAAKAVSVAATNQGQENARLPVLSEASRHSTSKDGGKEGKVILRDTSSLSADHIKARRQRERLLNAAQVLGMVKVGA